MVRVLVCDDESRRATSLRGRLKSRISGLIDIDIVPLSVDAFADAVHSLEDRQRAARDGRGANQGDPHPFDDIDVLFVDYDLLKLDESGGAQSGERVCYLARCYSSCGIIVGYNQFAYHSYFDLTLLGHIRSFADINISMDMAASTGLWSDSFTGFRPWNWPILPLARERMTHLADAIANRLSSSILSTLGLDGDELYRLFTTEQLELISPRVDPRTATFESFLRDSPIALRPRDEPWRSDATARIAVARIMKWIERTVLPHQNILVDAPHLISRFPSLIGPPHTEERWNATCQLAVSADDLGFDADRVSANRFLADDWISRPTWLWPALATDSSIEEVRDPWAARPDNLVFCEDVSRFRRRTSAREFRAEVAPEFNRRYVQKLKGVDYMPDVRFLM
jgi:hypothetical protein